MEMTTPDQGDRWTFCGMGHIHWGALGGAGLLLRYVPPRGQPVHLLTERSRWVDEGGTWGIPGAAINDGESPEEAAHREAAEEIWPVPAYRVTGSRFRIVAGAGGSTSCAPMSMSRSRLTPRGRQMPRGGSPCRR
jgi:NUDIX domain